MNEQTSIYNIVLREQNLKRLVHTYMELCRRCLSRILHFQNIYTSIVNKWIKAFFHVVRVVKNCTNNKYLK